MADDSVKAINSLLSTLRFYADPEYKWTEDMCLDEKSPFFLKPGERARAVVGQTVEMADDFVLKNINFESCDVTIRQLSADSPVMEIVVDGCVQECVTRLCIDINTDGAMLRLEKSIGGKRQ